MEKVVEVLKKGGVAIFPTDTVYGIGTIPLKNSLKKIYDIKKRDFSKKIIALISNFESIREIIDESDENYRKILPVLEKYWPGDLTVIFNGNKELLKKFDDSMDTIGLRIPKNKIALEIIEKSGGIILTSSANLSGEQSVTNIKDININVIERVDIYIEANEKLTGIPSTIIKYENGEITLVREGNIKIKEILKIMKGE